MINKVNFESIIQRLHEYAEGGYIDIYDVQMATSIVAGSNSVAYTDEVIKILVDLKMIGESQLDPSGTTRSVLKYKLL